MKILAKWSVDEYHHMIEAGVLRDRHVELLGGEIIEMSPETPSHYSTAKRGTKYLEELFSGRADIRFNGPITLTDSEPEPDIAIVRLPESNYSSRHPVAEDIFWIIEIAKSSLRKDREIKSAIYASAGIQEYWILDLASKKAIIFRKPEGDKYCEELEIVTGAIAPVAFADIEVSVDRLLP